MGVNHFLLGLSHDLHMRCQRLIYLSSVETPYQELASFSLKVTEKLLALQEQIIQLQNSDIIKDHRFWRDAYLEYQDISSEVALLEQFAIPVLIRYNDADHIARHLITQLAYEIGYPQELLPVPTTTSNQYYWAKPELRIVAMPTGDIGGILGWPDLMHELAHILLESWPEFLNPFKSILKDYYLKKRQSIIDLGISGNNIKWLEKMKIAWGDKEAGMWQIEMAANLIAVYVTGSSFGWQHIRLSINHGSSPFTPSPGDPLEDHPADQAQLECISEMLALMGARDESNHLLNQWNEIVNMSLAERPQGYQLYYAPELLKGIAQTVFDGCKAKGLIPFTDNYRYPDEAIVVNLIDQAWKQFNMSSENYPSWEVSAVQNLRHYLLKTL